MSRVCGWMGTILRVDLTDGTITKEPFTEELRTGFIGGYGLGSKILYDETGPETDPLDPQNRLIISAGPLDGALALAGCRVGVMVRSPETGIIGYTSGGGHFAPEVKYAGYDAIIVQGKAPKPVYLWIEDDNVELRDARHLWSKTISETYKMQQDEHGPDIRSIGIGPGGENLIRFACLVTDDLRTPGGCGTGCVAGSKNLKNIVVRGSKTIHIADPDKVLEIEKEALTLAKTRLRYAEARTYGTTTLIAGMGGSGSMGVRNYQYSSESPTFGQKQWSRLRHDYIIENYPHKWVSCFGCPVRCSAWVDLDERFGKYACKSGRPDGGGLLSGINMEVGSYAAIVKWNELCDQYGMGVNETKAAIAAAMEWSEKGIITKRDTDGKEIRFGDADAVIELTHKIARREGFGDILAEGSLRAARIVGAPEEAIARAGKGRCGNNSQIAGSPILQLGLAVSARGFDHLSGTFNASYSGVSVLSKWAEIYKREGIPSDSTVPHPAMAILTVIYEDELKMANLLGTCVFAGIFKLNYDREEGDMPYYASILSAVTGMDFNPEQLIRTSERVINLQKAYNVRLGLGRKDDGIPARFQTPRSGPRKGAKFSQEEFDKMLDRYYELHGWDPQTGIPRRDTLEELGLEYVADDLEKRGIELGRGGHKYDMNDIPLEVRGIKA